MCKNIKQTNIKFSKINYIDERNVPNANNEKLNNI